MRTIAEFKRTIVLGTRIRQVHNYVQGNVNQVLTVVRVQSNGFYCTSPESQRPGWIPFPKRSDITFTERGWIRTRKGEKVSEYEWVRESEPAQQDEHF